MAEYIDREALEADLNNRLSALRYKNGYYDHYTDGFDECVDRVENFPAADVAPVRHGKWTKQKCQGDYGLCSECNCRIPWIPKNYTYCPGCGAKMDGGSKNEVG